MIDLVLFGFGSFVLVLLLKYCAAKKLEEDREAELINQNNGNNINNTIKYKYIII